MKNKTTIALYLLCTMFLVSNAESQTPQFRELTLNMSPTKTGFVPLEPIPLRFVLENRTDAGIPVRGGLGFRCSSLRLFVERPDGSVVSPEQLSPFLARCLPTEKAFPSGARYETVEVLTFPLERYFNQLGRYRIRASFKSTNGSQTIWSSWSPLEIVQPIGTNLAAYDFLKENVGKLSTFFSSYDRESVEDAKTFISIFPDSVYSDYVRYPLAGYYTFNQEPAKAREQLLKLRGKENFPYSKDVDEQLQKLDALEFKKN